MATTCLSFVFVLAVSTVLLNMCGCEQHVVQWTVEGTNGGHLNVNLGDIVVMSCSKFLYCNIIYVEDREQYDNCDAYVTDGKVVKIGNCLVNLTGIRNYTERIQGLSPVIEDSNIIDYKPGMNYYFLSFADGTAQSVVQSPNSGGLCEEGLKMIISVGSTSSPISQATSIATPVYIPSTTPGAGKGSGTSKAGAAVIAGTICGVLLLLLCVVVGVVVGVMVWRHTKDTHLYSMDKELNPIVPGDVIYDTPIDTVATSDPNTSTNVAYGANKEVVTTSNPAYNVVQSPGDVIYETPSDVVGDNSPDTGQDVSYDYEVVQNVPPHEVQSTGAGHEATNTSSNGMANMACGHQGCLHHSQLQ